jgi:acyl carrier protein
MDQPKILARIHEYIANEVLEGDANGLSYSTPLLEIGVINSVELIRLVTFIERTFAVCIPADQMVSDHFGTVEAIGRLVFRLQSPSTVGAQNS